MFLVLGKGTTMALQFKDLTIESRTELEPFFDLREIKSCEYNFNVMFIWAKVNGIKYAVSEHFAVLSEVMNGRFITLMPLCEEKYFSEATEAVLEYYQLNNLKFSMYVADKVFADFVEEQYPNRFDVVSDRDFCDYIYDGDKLRTLIGNKYSKKRNHLNAFYGEYEGRYHYRKLTQEDKTLVCQYLRRWVKNKDEVSEALDDELEAICRVIDHLDRLDIKCGGIFVDDQLEAFSIGTLINKGKEAVIHVEKANEIIRGMYPLINTVFLNNEFPEVEWVNREEDLGIEGLRKAKLSYNPIEVLEKYTFFEKE